MICHQSIGIESTQLKLILEHIPTPDEHPRDFIVSSFAKFIPLLTSRHA